MAAVLTGCSQKPSGNRTPVATLVPDRTLGSAPLNVTFVGAALDADGDALSYAWDFGDGTTKGGEVKETHTYINPGMYTATMTASDGKGGTVIVTATVRVMGGVSSLSMNEAVTSVEAGDGYVVVGDAGGNLSIVDVADASNLRVLASSKTFGGYVSDIHLAGKNAYVALYDRGLQVFDLSSPGNPALVGQLELPQGARGVHVNGDYAYFTDTESRMHVVDVSNISSPTIIRSFDTCAKWASGVDVSGDLAFVFGYSPALSIIDVSSPAHPALKASVDFPWDASNVQVVDNYAYLATTGGLATINVSNPVDPRTEGFVSILGATGVIVRASLAYVTSYPGELVVVDVSRPGVPAIVDSIKVPGHPRGVRVDGTYAYVAVENGLSAPGGSLQVIYVSP